MEESDEPDQPISAGRQEIRKRRRPSQPMVDKSQQTEVTEKKKSLPMPQLSGPKASLSIGNIPGSKVNYESLRISSQLQQTWMKRKHVQDMTDKSLQTDTIAEEKKEEIKSVGETVVPEEKPAAVGEAAPEFLESVQEIEIPPSRHSIQLKIDRSQQTSCTGDGTMINTPQSEKVDKEQQTYFSDSEIVFIGKPGSSFSNSKEGAQMYKSPGKIFVSEHPEFQPATCSSEEIRQNSISRSSFSQQNIKSTPVLLEDEQYVLVEVQPPTAEETPAELQPPPAEEAHVEEALSEEPSAEVQPPAAEEAPVETQPSPAEEPPAEEAPTEVLSLPVEEPPAEEVPAKADPAPAEEDLLEELSAEVQPPPAEEAPTQEAPELQFLLAVEAPIDEVPDELQPPLAEKTTAEEVPDKVQPPATEEAPALEALAEVQPPPTEEAPIEEGPAEVQSPPTEEAPIEEAPAEVHSPPAEEAATEEAPAETQPPPAEEPAAEEAPAELQSPPAEDAAAEEAPAEPQSPPAEEATAEEALAEPQSPPAEEAAAEEAPAELQPLPAEEAAAEEAPAELQPPPAEEAPAEEDHIQLQPPPTEETTSEMVPVDKQPPSATEPNFITQISMKDIPAEVQPPPSQQTPAAEPLVENVSTEHQSPQTADGPVVTLESMVLKDEPIYEEPLELDPVPEDSSNIKNEQVSTIEIDGVIRIQRK